MGMRWEFSTGGCKSPMTGMLAGFGIFGRGGIGCWESCYEGGEEYKDEQRDEESHEESMVCCIDWRAHRWQRNMFYNSRWQ